MSLLGSLLGSVGISGVSSGMDVLGNLMNSWALNSSRESLNKSIQKTNYKIQKKYDLWTQEQDKLYEQWYQNYMYQLQNNEYYNLAEKYATNTAKWAVEGLKKAGLNPVLAAQNPNMSSNLGDVSISGSGHRTGGGGVGGSAPSVPSGGASGTMLSQISNLEQNTSKSKSEQSTVEAMRGPTVANAAANNAKVTAEADLIAAQAQQTRVQTENIAKNAGLGGSAGLIMRGASSFRDHARKIGEQLGSAAGFVDRKMDDLIDSTTKAVQSQTSRMFTGPFSLLNSFNSAKSISDRPSSKPVQLPGNPKVERSRKYPLLIHTR